MMNHRPFVLIDVETTGSSAQHARVTEIGALRVEHGEVISRLQLLVNPGQKIPYFITKLTGITNEMVAKAPPFEELSAELITFLDGAIFVAHHVGFDYSFIKAEFARAGIRFNADRVCTVKLSRRLHPEQTRHGLDKMIARLGIEVKQRHRAYDDAEVLWRFFADEYAQDPLRLMRSIDRLMVRSRTSLY